MPRRELKLDDELSRMLDDLVAAGRYPTPDAAVDAGLRLLAARDAAREEALTRLREKVEEGWQQSERGELIDGQRVIDELRSRYAEDAA